MYTRLAVVALLATLAACQTQAPQVRSDAASGVDFAAFRTFGFHDPLSTDKNGYSTLTTGHLKSAVEREMSLRGFKRVDEAPDVLVNFTVATRESISSGTSPRVGVSYGGWSGGGLGMGVGMSTGGGVDTYTEGTLTIDIVDRVKNQLVWTGSAVGRIPRDAANKQQALIDKVVQLIYEQYPRAPTAP